jgi:hypothetical protein
VFDKFSKKLSKFNKKNQKSRDAMKKYAKLKKKESVDEALHHTLLLGNHQNLYMDVKLHLQILSSLV